jgi:hypothetical protein
MKHIVFLIMALVALAQGTAAYAQKKTFVRDYTYQASELDNKVTARTNASNEIRNMLLREVGEFLHTKRTLTQDAHSQHYSETVFIHPPRLMSETIHQST